MKYVIIFGAIIVFLIIYTVISTRNSLKKAPEKLNKAKKLYAEGNSNAALKELGEAFALPFGDKITPEYNVHLLAVLDLLKEILNGMNISSDKLTTKLHKRLSEATKTIELEEYLTKPLKEFFENTESDEKLAEFLKKAAISGEIGVINTDKDSGPNLSDRTNDFINRGGKFLMKGDYKSAIAVYEEALAQSWEPQEEAFLYDQLASCHLMNTDLVKAEENYRKSISIEAYFTNVWNYCDFLVYNKRKADAEAYLPQLAQLIKSNSDQKDYDSLFKKWNGLA
jgi:tetratricopeptide (TPR) repeat protein